MMKRCLLLILSLIFLLSICHAEDETTLSAAGYVLVTSGDETRCFALPEEEAYSFTVKRTTADGTEMSNTITITPEGVYVSEADCDNQDCVDEGMVTLENKETRVLGNAILCLPHQLLVELFTTEEMQELLDAQEGAQ